MSKSVHVSHISSSSPLLQEVQPELTLNNAEVTLQTSIYWILFLDA